MPPTRRRSGSPSPEALAGLREQPPAPGRLRKAPESDPVLGIASSPGTPPAGVAPAPSTTAPKAPNTPRRSAATPSPTGSGSKAKVGFYQDPDDTARARAAYNWTRAQEGHRSFSDFLASAIMREVERLERDYHEGTPWPSVEAGELPTGKPLGA